MPLVALHAASVEQRSGVLILTNEGAASWRLRIELQRGWVHGFGIEPAFAGAPDPKRPDELRERRERDAELAAVVAPVQTNESPVVRFTRLLRLAVQARFKPRYLDEARLPYVATTPFHPLAALRAAVSAMLSPVEARATQTVDASKRTLRVALPLHASAVDPDEQAALKLLTQPREWDELVRRSRTTPQRLLTLLRDAAAIGALRIGDAAQDELGPLLLTLMHEAPAEVAARRAAYHQAARAVHPDMHPSASDEDTRRLTEEMADLAARRRRGG